MKRNGSQIATLKKKKRAESPTLEQEEEDEPFYSEPDEEDENESNDRSEKEDQLSDEEEDDDDDVVQDSNDDDDAGESEDETQEANFDSNDEAEECNSQDGDGDYDSKKHSPAKHPTARNKVRKVKPLPKKKQGKAGVIYISSIPKHMNVTILRSLLEPYGDIGRIYLQPAQKDGKVRTKTASGKRAMMQYTEGWVEFLNKRVAKAIVPMLNMQPITNKRKSVFRDILWSMKYLSGFKWIHLNERLAYERAVAKEKMREQIQQIRKEVSYHETKVHLKEVALKNAAKEKKEQKSKKE
uniref:Activator of basal transcription 1 n=1 Tax=Anopheles epiroticus TaxID=199890 RepID=A0A182P7D9_9DIPT